MITFEQISMADAKQHLERLLADKTDTSGGLCDVADMTAGGPLFVAWRAGQPLAVVAVRKLTRAHGRELEIRAVVALDNGGGLTAALLPAIEYRFGWDCDAVTIYTRRRGLVRQLERAGYGEAAKIMRKNLK